MPTVNPIEIPELSAKDLEKFHQRVKQAGPDECWLWQGAHNRNGYGNFTVYEPHRRRIRSYKAHRIAYMLASGNDPGKLYVLHSCDQPLCCNPFHLSVGSSRDNMVDMTTKGRFDPLLNLRWGSQHHRAKLNWEKVGEIRKLRTEGLSTRALARIFSISRAGIMGILRGDCWKIGPDAERAVGLVGLPLSHYRQEAPPVEMQYDGSERENKEK